MTLILVFLFFVIEYGSCQVCSETRSILREVPETYRFTYIETYEEPCVIFCTVKTRKAVDITTRTVQHYENVTVNVCCEGYVEDSSHGGNGLYCKPICYPDCQNGYCKRPNECACKVGYAVDPLEANNCKPLCLKDCDIPDCLSTKASKCFSNNTEESNPVCSTPCVNANCVAPNVCQCLQGYYKTSENICELQIPLNISTTCNQGTCNCDIGWQWRPGTCQPVCFGCEFGICMGPQECKCYDGYIKSDKGKCEPYCSKGCPNGKCVSPEICRCNPGWYIADEGGQCLAHCNMRCDNGKCVAPNICECNSGYQLARDGKHPRCVQLHKACRDNSSISDCKCDSPYMVNYSTDDGRECDCFTNCSDLSIVQCTKSFCVLYNDDFNTSSMEIEDEAVKIHEINVAPLDAKSNNKIDKDESIPISRPGLKMFKGIDIRWIYGIAAGFVLILLLILGFTIKKKCCKLRTLSLPDKNSDIVMHYSHNPSSNSI